MNIPTKYKLIVNKNSRQLIKGACICNRPWQIYFDWEGLDNMVPGQQQILPARKPDELNISKEYALLEARA